MSGYSLQQLWSLNGHGLYVWGSLALCALAVLIEWQALRQARKNALRRISRLQRNKGKTQA
ncbi:heme exporter protein CcmD [Achromobacter sp. F4_2707]|uniref:heme exporter protein CcmD n=1 Tax=Achromobacter sp. F4_2707 TaxID=3114286 RepID=UPI0039C6747A